MVYYYWETPLKNDEFIAKFLELQASFIPNFFQNGTLILADFIRKIIKASISYNGRPIVRLCKLKLKIYK